MRIRARTNRARLTTAGLVAGAMLYGQQASVTLIDFERVRVSADSFVVLKQDRFAYQDMRWSGFYLVDTENKVARQLPLSGYRTGRVSGRFIAVGGNVGVAKSEIQAAEDGQRFDLVSGHFTAVWRNGLKVRFEGMRNQTLVAEREVSLDVAGPRFVELDFRDVDMVLISSVGGEDAGACGVPTCRSGRQFAVDDLRMKLGEPALITKQQQSPAPEVIPPGAGLSRAEVAGALANDRRAAEAPSAAPPEQEPSEDEVANVAVTPETDAHSHQVQLGDCDVKSYYGVQTGAFRSRDNAVELASNLEDDYGTAQIHVKDTSKGDLYFVIAGCFDQSGAASSLLSEIESSGRDALAVRASESRFGPVLEGR